MESSYSSGLCEQRYQVDMKKVNEAFAKAGVADKLFNPPTEQEYQYLTHHNLTVFQWRLREFFKLKFDQELKDRCEDENLFFGTKKVFEPIGKLSDRMKTYQECATDSLEQWAYLLGVLDYFKEFVNSCDSNASIYRKFSNFLRTLY